jgi:hypothetical protein
VIYAPVGIRLGVENIQIAIPTADVQALAFFVHEHVVCVGTQLHVPDWSAIVEENAASLVGFRNATRLPSGMRAIAR